MSINWIGISNEQEFYSQHYLSEVFENDLKEMTSAWEKKAKKSKIEIKDAKDKGLPSPDVWRTPYDTLKSLARDYLHELEEISSLSHSNGEEHIKRESELNRRLLGVFGYDDYAIKTEGSILLDDGVEVPVIAQINTLNGRSLLWIAQASPLGGGGGE